jgi:hypothetical protein
MGPLEKELEAGITYMLDNSPETIAATILQVIKGRGYERRAKDAAQQMFGPTSVSKSLDALLQQVTTAGTRKN